MTLADRRARLLALEVEHATKKAINACFRAHQGLGDVFAIIAGRHGLEAADEARQALAKFGAPSPWPSSQLALLYVRIKEEKELIAKMEAAIGPQPKRDTVNGKGWTLIDDVERGVIVFRVACVKLPPKLAFALRGQGFKTSKEVGYCCPRSDGAWEKGLRLGSMLEEGRGERPPDPTDATSTGK